MAEIHNSDVGVVFKATIRDETDTVVDVSGATTQEFFFTPLGGTKLTKTTSFTSDGTDGVIQYTSVAADFTTSGLWNWQAHIVTSTRDFKTSIVEFTVLDNL